VRSFRTTRRKGEINQEPKERGVKNQGYQEINEWCRVKKKEKEIPPAVSKNTQKDPFQKLSGEDENKFRRTEQTL